MDERELPGKIAMNARLCISLSMASLLWTPVGLQAAEVVISDYYRPEIWLRRIVVDREEYKLDRLERRFRQYLLQSQGVAKLVQLLVFLNRDDALENCQCMTDINYMAWRGQFDDYRNHIAPTAELTVVGQSALMRVRDLEGRIHSTVLRGNHPLRIATDNCVAEAIHVLPDVIRRPPRPRFEWDADLTFYVVAQPPLTKSCAEIAAREIHRAAQVERIRVHVRADAWFIDGQFPIVYSFQENINPPSQEVHTQAPEIGCFATRTSVRCSGDSPNP